MDVSSNTLTNEVAVNSGRSNETVSFGQTLGDALRLAVWRTPRYPQARMSGLAMAGIYAVVAVSAIAGDLIESGGAWRSFSPYGLNGVLAALLLVAAVIVAFSHIDRTQATARRLMLVLAMMTFASFFENLALYLYGPFESGPAKWTAAAIPWIAMGPITYIWLAGAARQAFRPTPAVRRPALRGVAFLVVLTLAALLPPGWPMFARQHFDRRSANLWEYGQAFLYARQNAEQSAAAHAQQVAEEAKAARLEAGQGGLLANAVGQLATRDPARANVFTIGVAGWSDQDVFLKEIRQSTDILKSHFQLGDRTLNLINNAATAQQAPMATMANLGQALRAVAQRMDRDNDLMVLVLSSHGSRDGFALSYGDYVDRALDPQTLRLLLDDAGIKNRVVIVSSCYSGTFVAPLQNPDTMILTAASADRTSFGCADDRRWTWFGEALFEKGLAEHSTLADAFAAARTTISSWERAQNLTPSQPQIFVGDEIARRFPDIVGVSTPESHAAAAPAQTTAKAE